MRFNGPPISIEDAEEREQMYQKWMALNNRRQQGGMLDVPLSLSLLKKAIKEKSSQASLAIGRKLVQEIGNHIYKNYSNKNTSDLYPVRMPADIVKEAGMKVAELARSGKGMSGGSFGMLAGLASAAIPWLINAAKTILPSLGLGVVGGLGNVFGRKMGGYEKQNAKGLTLPGTKGYGLTLPGTKGYGLTLPGSGGSLKNNQSKYFKYSISLSTQQKSKIKAAAKNNEPVKIRLSHAKLSGNDTILLSKRQINRILARQAQGKGTEITLTPTQIQTNISGGFFWIPIATALLAAKATGVI